MMAIAPIGDSGNTKNATESVLLTVSIVTPPKVISASTVQSPGSSGAKTSSAPTRGTVTSLTVSPLGLIHLNVTASDSSVITEDADSESAAEFVNWNVLPAPYPL